MFLLKNALKFSHSVALFAYIHIDSFDGSSEQEQAEEKSKSPCVVSNHKCLDML